MSQDPLRAALAELLSLYDQRIPLRERPEVWERARAALAAAAPAAQPLTAEQHFRFSQYELEDMAKNPRVLAALMDYHEVRQTESDVFFGGETTTGNKLRKQALYERGRSIMAEDLDVWDNELRKAFGFPLYAAAPTPQAPAAQPEPVQAITHLRSVIQAYRYLQDARVAYEEGGGEKQEQQITMRRAALAIAIYKAQEFETTPQAEPATADQVCELTAHLERMRAAKIVADVAALEIGGATVACPNQFQSGYALACDEIAHRLKTEAWGLQPGGGWGPTGAANDEDKPAPDFAAQLRKVLAQPAQAPQAVPATSEDQDYLQQDGVAAWLDAQHPDDAAVDRFAKAMKLKLKAARDKGRSGWQTCPPADLSRMLREHVDKGDPRDVANFCMFLHEKGAGIEPAQAPQAPQAVPLTFELIRELRDDCREVFSADVLGTPQDVLDVIEYVDSWLKVFLEKRLAARPTQPADTPQG